MQLCFCCIQTCGRPFLHGNFQSMATRSRFVFRSHVLAPRHRSPSAGNLRRHTSPAADRRSARRAGPPAPCGYGTRNYPAPVMQNQLSSTSYPEPEAWCRPPDIWLPFPAGNRQAGARSGSESAWCGATVRRRTAFGWTPLKRAAPPASHPRNSLVGAPTAAFHTNPAPLPCGQCTLHSVPRYTTGASFHFTSIAGDQPYAPSHFATLCPGRRTAHRAMIRWRHPTSSADSSPRSSPRRATSRTVFAATLALAATCAATRASTPAPFSASRQAAAGPSFPTGHAPESSFACLHSAARPVAERGTPSVRLYTAIGLEN